MNWRRQPGRIVMWNPITWWGYILSSSCQQVAFHGTCVAGMTADTILHVGDNVTIIWSDNFRSRLLSVELTQP